MKLKNKSKVRKNNIRHISLNISRNNEDSFTGFPKRHSINKDALGNKLFQTIIKDKYKGKDSNSSKNNTKQRYIDSSINELTDSPSNDLLY